MASLRSPTMGSVCAEFGTTLESLSTRGQHNHTARDAAVLLYRELLNESFETLAARFGGVSKSAISEIAKRARPRIPNETCEDKLLETPHHTSGALS